MNRFVTAISVAAIFATASVAMASPTSAKIHAAKAHVEHIIGKLGVSDRVQAVVWAARNGIAGNPLLAE